MDDSWLILVSLVGLIMAPAWAKWWNDVLKRTGISRPQRVAGVLILSVATLLVVFVRPWVLVMIMRGTTANLADPLTQLASLLFFGLGVALQVFAALNVALQRDHNSN